jgi:Holliday junction DNA helicase RuvB
MEDFSFDFVIGQGPGARSIKLDVPKFTLVGATTRAGLISAPLRGALELIFTSTFIRMKIWKRSSSDQRTS